MVDKTREKENIDKLAKILVEMVQLGESAPQEIHTATFDAALIFYVPPSLHHPLRELLGYERAFLLLSKNSSDISPEQLQDKLALRRQITVGAASTEMRRYLGATESIAVHELWSELPFSSRKILQEPLDRDDARYILSLSALARQPGWGSLEHRFPLILAYVINLQGDREFVGLQELDADFSLEREISLFTTISVKNYGIVTMEPEVNSSPLPSLENIISLFVDLGGSENETSMLVSSRYDVLAETSLPKYPNQSSSYIYLEAQWRGVQKILASPPTTAMVTLQMRCVSGRLDTENYVGTRPILIELEKLQEWFANVAQDTKWNKNLTLEDTGEKISENLMIGHLVDQFLEDVKTEGSLMNIDDSASVMDNSDIFSHLPLRRDLDFTERFWKFCQAAVNHDDITEAFTAMIEELETGRLLPLIHKENHSNLANLIRECLKLSRLQTTPDYNEQKESISRAFDNILENPLECLCEVGIFKLRRDYSFYLVGNNLISWSQLSSLLDVSNPLSDQIYGLRRLHRVFEVWYLIKSTIFSAPFESLRTLVQAVTLWFCHEDFTEEDIERELRCTIYLPRFSGETGKMITNISRSMEPSLWKLTLFEEPIIGVTDGCKSQNSGPALMTQFSHTDNLFGSGRSEIEFDVSKVRLADIDTAILDVPMIMGLENRYHWVVGTER